MFRWAIGMVFMGGGNVAEMSPIRFTSATLLLGAPISLSKRLLRSNHKKVTKENIVKCKAARSMKQKKNFIVRRIFVLLRSSTVDLDESD